ncbi:TIGR04282 family arsenosugar biosynthesis glycosyltransferase [Patiriisocius marinus]|uniref:TIGR04282 family arsenosugar biosynthesis glycosyltransferase n=1 Tax=Patiriisocius marinus TaxID=1397112 RepID=UPI001F18CD4E|nr:DUF2064 domain-containing protein [Patiriisocius marinus]
MKSAVLFNELNKKTIAKVEKTGLPYFHISETEQIGNSFGERYTNAIKQVYAQGFENVITIGNDSPRLKTSQLLKAAKELEKKAMVLGPSRDGGYYLLGLNKSHFNAALFLKLPWQTSRLTQNITRLFSTKNIEVTLLESLNDIDNIDDAKSFIDGFQKISEELLKILRAFFYSEKLPLRILSFRDNMFHQKIYFNKGSPFPSL